MRRPVHGGNLVWAASIAGCPIEEILDFSASINPLGPPESVLRGIQGAMANIQHYPDPSNSELKGALSRLHDLPPDWILPGNGSAELLTLVGRDLAGLTATVVVTPAFADYYRALRGYDAKVVDSPWQLFLEEPGGVAISREISSELGVRSEILNTDICSRLGNGRNFVNSRECGLIVNNPHNPTGILFKREAIVSLLAKFRMVVVDEAFMDFLPPAQAESLVEMVSDYPNLVILRSLTKFYSVPGLRIGYAIAQPQVLQRWQSWRDPWSVNVLATAAAVAALNDRAFQKQTWEWLPSARQQLQQGLQSIPGLQPLTGAANFLLVRTNYPATQLQQLLLKRDRILIRDCLSFPELGEAFFRVAVRTEAENQRLINGLRVLIQEWE